MISILYLDKSNFYRSLFEDISKEKRIKYISIQDEELIFNILENRQVDVIVIGIDDEEDTKGENLVRALNESSYKSIPIIITTSYDNIAYKKKMFQLGVIDFVSRESFVDSLNDYITKFMTINIIDNKIKDTKIAVLDDNNLALQMVRRIFENNDIKNVDYYNDPVELLNTEKSYDLYFIDLVMPRLSGEQVIVQLRKKHLYSVIIGLSSIDNSKTISNILTTGADDYIIKPFVENVFLARLKTNVRTFLLMKELKEKNKKLIELVNIDGMTKLYNHKYICTRLEEEMQRCQRYGNELSIILFDIDKFKGVNDIYGHLVGDEVLIKIAELLKVSLRKADIVGRYGGEEFLVILPETSREGACMIGEKLLKTIEATTFEEEGLRVTLSGGVATFDKEDFKNLIKNADRLLYKAKDNGRNRIES